MKNPAFNSSSQKEKEAMYIQFRSIENCYASVYSKVLELEKKVNETQQRWQGNPQKISLPPLSL